MRPWRQNGAKWGVLCPKIGVSYFRKKWFGVLRTLCEILHVPKSGFLISGKNGLVF